MASTIIIYIIVYVVIFVAALIAEFLTNELISIWFALGAAAGIICTFWPDFPEASIFAFLLVSGISLIIFICFFRKKFLQNKGYRTNVDSLIGKKFMLLSDTTNLKSTVKINDTVWNCECDEELKKDSYVIVEKIVGNHLVVKKYKE